VHASPLHSTRVHAGSRLRAVDASARLVSLLVVHVLDVESVDMAREITMLLVSKMQGLKVQVESAG
jgi:hypothetical protein